METGTRTTRTVPAATVRAGNCLLVDGYHREVVRIEKAIEPASDEPDKTGAGLAEIQLRICFLNGGSLTIPRTHDVTLACGTNA